MSFYIQSIIVNTKTGADQIQLGEVVLQSITCLQN